MKDCSHAFLTTEWMRADKLVINIKVHDLLFTLLKQATDKIKRLQFPPSIEHYNLICNIILLLCKATRLTLHALLV